MFKQKTLFLYLFLFFLLGKFNLRAQTIELINIEKQFANRESCYTNGYATYLSGDNITYGNLWNKNTEGFITRGTNGKMEIKWQSDPVTKVQNGKAYFLFLVCLDQANKSVNFQTTMNGVPIGSFVNFHQETWSKKESNGVEISFQRFASTVWKDGAMFMTIAVPQKMITIGQSVTFTVTGENASSNAWFILLGHSVGTKSCASNGDYAMLSLPLNALSSTSLPFELVDQKRVLFSLLDLNTAKNGEELSGDSFSRTLVTDQIENKGKTITFTRQHSNSMDCFRQLSQSNLNNAEAFVMVSSHQDIAWMDSPYKCIEDRDKLIVSPALRLLEKHTDYCYDIEDGLILEEYLGRHPEERNNIARFLKEGRLGIGASYTQPYEEMQSGEALARQFYYGKRWVEKTFPGASSRTYWNVDVPGRTLQMAQILKKSGVDYIMCSRQERGVYNWASPDGSSVSVFTPGHYSIASPFLLKSPKEGIEAFSDYMHSFKDYRNDTKASAKIGFLSAEDMSEAHTYYHWVDGMKEMSQREILPLPTVKHSTSNMFMDALSRDKENFPKLNGERPDIWLYIHGPGHERALTTYRKAECALRAAEVFSTTASLVDGSFKRYPEASLEKAWKALIYPDHGWGGNKGFITDSLFLEKYRESDKIAGTLIDESLLSLSSNIRSRLNKGLPITVFNSLSYQRSEPVCVTVDLKKNPLQSLVLKDCDGKDVWFQVKELDEVNQKAVIEFIANDIPSIGYSTYYLAKGKSKTSPTSVMPKYYKLEMNNGMLTQITDIELNEPLFDASKFAIGDVFTMQSVGNGAGEFSSVQKPDMRGFEQCKEAKWNEIASGAVFALYKSEKQMADAKIIRYMKVYKTLKRIDFDTEIRGFNGKDYREFRQAFPLRSKGTISYEVPFGNVTVGEDEMKGKPGERYQDEAKDIHPRGIGNYLSSSSDKVGVTLSSSVVVADYIDPTDKPINQTVLQPILFASRRSCHWLGEFYSQAGDHFFHFSITSHAPSWKNGAQQGISSNTPLWVAANPNVYQKASLPEKGSFFSLDEANVRISTIKKAEDSDHVVLRLYDWKGENKKVSIHSFLDYKKLQRTTLIETEPVDLDNKSVSVGAFSVETFKLSY